MTVQTGRLVLVATPIGNLGDITLRALDVLRTADVVLCEDTRHSRKLFQHFDIPTVGRLRAAHQHNEAAAAESVVRDARAGLTVAYISDAGMPGVSDPGERLVAACVAAEIPVEVVPGASAVIAGLVLSGFSTDRFVFEGFLPRRGTERAQRLHALAVETRTVVCFEAPHRMIATIGDLAEVCGGTRLVALARELTKLHETIWRGPLSKATAYLELRAPRGEYVIVLAPAVIEERFVTDAELTSALTPLIDEGMSTRDAADAVSEALGVARRRVYETATALRRGRRP
ncbi:MAG: 16S rRNA (cytidine(1402)-2'-O)-methyltransferase [Acidimicrobiia bacterium]